MLKLKKLLPHKFQSYLIYGIIIFSLINVFNSFGMHVAFINLVENQILYIFSALAQVVGALLGLTIAGYSIIDSKLKSIGASDSTITDYTDDIRNDYFFSLMMIIILSIMDILLCIFILCIYNNIFNIVAPLLMNQSMLLFIFIMIEIVYFVNFLNPNKIKEKGSADKETIELSFESNPVSSSDDDSFSPFVTYYNLLEKLIRDYACELVNSPYSSNKLKIMDALYVLVKYEIISKQTSSIVDELRRYRNALVHSLDTDKTVNKSAYLELEKIYTTLKDIYDNRDNQELFNEKRSAFYNYSAQLGYGEIENRIISYLKVHSQASISDLSDHLGLTRANTIRRLNNLQELGVLENIGTHQRTRWSLKQ